jgi:hypothetical protein
MSSSRSTRLIAILLGRLGMSVPQAIKGYNTLAAVLETALTEDKKARESNMARFREAFEKILLEKGYTSSTPMRVRTEGDGTCKV